MFVNANMCTLERTHERGNQGIAKRTTGKTCTSAKHLFTWYWSVHMLGHKCSFPNSYFLFWP